MARAIVAKDGVDALTLPYLAERARVSKPVVYDHFPTRQILCTTLIRDYADYVMAQIAAAVARHRGDLDATVRETTRAYFNCVEERGISLHRLWASSMPDPDMDTARRRYREKLFRVFAEGFAPMTGVDPRLGKLAAAMLVASSEAAIEQWEGGHVPRHAAEALQVAFVFAAIALRNDERVRELMASLQVERPS